MPVSLSEGVQQLDKLEVRFTALCFPWGFCGAPSESWQRAWKELSARVVAPGGAGDTTLSHLQLLCLPRGQRALT